MNYDDSQMRRKVPQSLNHSDNTLTVGYPV